jgi:hypothetical protein
MDSQRPLNGIAYFFVQSFHTRRKGRKQFISFEHTTRKCKKKEKKKEG